MSDTTAIDETYDAEGKVVKTATRQLDEPIFSTAQYRDAIRAVRVVMGTSSVPLWGRAIARLVLMLAYKEAETNQPIEPVPPHQRG